MTSAGTALAGTFPVPVDSEQPATGHVDHRWVTRVISREGPGILRMLWRILGREHDVMDAYQDCFCKLALRGRRGQITSAKAYAYRTAANVAIEMIRTRKRQAEHLPAVAAQRAMTQPGEPGTLGEGSSVPALREAITRLPDHLRNVVLLRDLSRMSYKDVAKTLGIEPGTARVYRRHAVVKLAEILGGEEES